VNVAAFHSICPHDILVQGCEHSLHVAKRYGYEAYHWA
jgi:hypothetical protein